MLLLPSARAALMATALVTMAGLPAMAMPGAHGGKCMPGVLNVSGHGESRVAPDQAMISLGVTTQAETAAQAMQDNATRQQAVLDALREAGLAETDIQTSGLTLNPVMNYPEDGTPPAITGYMAQNMLTVRVTDIARTGTVLDSIVTAGANEMQGISFIREDSGVTKDEALSAAVEDARHRAGVIAAAAGVELGAILRIGEPQRGMMPPEAPMMATARFGAADAKSIPVQGGEVAFTADVEVSFALSPAADCTAVSPANRPTRYPAPDTGSGDAAATPDTPPATEAPAN
ncbi:MAG: SIMPL domain-containing protein [Paracoccus sp. (in: a-proteobacteria)]|nr:SIMPL domain-containing protein [Paracoccus sp. (in: a-proteobacteria)]